MSLVATYVKCRDGNIYGNPVYKGDGWFICFDDDDPIELVVKKTCKQSAEEILKELDFNKCTTTKWKDMGKRNFDGLFFSARSCWIEPIGNSFEEPFPTPRPQDKQVKPKKFKNIIQGCFYGFTRKELNKTRKEN